MHFDKIRLTGFKSFADPTELIIADGLSGLVGPNGCGKSNLLEALRWVMGESRPTSVRGGGMDDVIFGGTEGRPPRDFAEVVLTIGNSADVEVGGVEPANTLEVVRRINREIGSAYRVNGKQVRARDIRRMFADASIGANSPSLVRQGQIAELVNAKPASRRRILEEAAGISGLHQRRREAELKLQNAEANLDRVADVIASLESQLKSLEHQVRQAARYREFGARLRQSGQLLLYQRWQSASEARAVASNTVDGATDAVAKTEKAIHAAQEKRLGAAESLGTARRGDTAASTALEKLRMLFAGLAAEEAQARQTIERQQAQVQQLEVDLNRESSLSVDAANAVSRLDDEQDELSEASCDHDARVEVAQKSAEAARERLREAETVFEALSRELAQLTASRQSSERRRTEAESMLARRTARAEETASRIEEARKRLDETNRSVAIALEEATAAKSMADSAEAELTNSAAATARAQAEQGAAWNAHSEAEGTASALRSEISALEKVLDESRKGGDQLMDAVRVEVGYEAAFGAALGDDLTLPGTDDESGSGWVSLPGYTGPPAMPGEARPLDVHVVSPPELGRRMSQTGLVAASEGSRLQGTLKPGQRLVSVEGDLWRWDGLRTSASDAPSRSAERLRQFNRLDSLRDALHDAEGRSAESARILARARERLSAAVTAEDMARDRRKSAEEHLTEISRRHSRFEAERDKLSGNLEALSLAREQLIEDIASAATMISEAEGGLQESGKLVEVQSDVDAARQKLSGARDETISRNLEHDALLRDQVARQERLAEIEAERKDWSLRAQTAAQRIRDLELRRDRAAIALSEAKSLPGEISVRRDELKTEVSRAENRRNSASDLLKAAEDALREAEQREREYERAASDAREHRARAEVMLETATDRERAASAMIAAETGGSPEDLARTLEIAAGGNERKDVATIEAEIVYLRRQRDALGAINLRAEEDASALASERDSLASERDELLTAVARLRSGIAALNKDGRARLLDAFNEVNSNFNGLFRHLFEGGRARLELVESDDPLEAGLEIICQPPGKKLSTLSLLSGGEQTLTAIALVFSVFATNPSPVCVLDEVDAPLDDANVDRFCRLLAEMKQRTDTRFLIITHHAITMARMDRLFGVTMAEKGVSQLVSVDLSRAEDLVVG